MVMRKFMASDNEALRISSDSPYGSAGRPIINNSDTPNGTIFEFTDGYQDHMISLDDTSANTEVFDDDKENSHVIVNGKGIVEDGTRVESESHIYVRQLNEYGQKIGPTIKLVVFSKEGHTSDVWGFASDTPLVDGAKYVKTHGSNWGDSNYKDFGDIDGVACFVSGTHIATPSGPRPVETLKAGDLVLTFDRGPQPIEWATSSKIALDPTSPNHPIRIQSGALGAGLPACDLMVSPQHRVLVHKDGKEVFVPAKALTPLKGIKCLKQARAVEYVHILLASHAIVMSEDLATESFFPGPIALAALPEATRQALQDHLATATSLPRTCRPCLTFREAKDWAKTLKGTAQVEIGLGANPATDTDALSA